VILLVQGAGVVGLAVVLAAVAPRWPGLGGLLPAVGAGLAGDLGLAAFYRGLATGSMSIVAPVAATGVVVPVLVGILTGDHPAALQLAGIVAAGAGVVLASREQDEQPPRAPGARGPAARPGGRVILLALLAALCFGGYFVGLRYSARHDVLWTLMAARLPGALVLLGMALVVARRAGEPPARGGEGGLWPKGRRQTGLLLGAGVLDVSANGLYALATRHGLLSIVSVASSLYPLATVALARLVLRERVRRLQELGVLAALTGVVLIAAG
jgi:drug/metabolite transporter (DMT)-like permease